MAKKPVKSAADAVRLFRQARQNSSGVLLLRVGTRDGRRYIAADPEPDTR